VILRMTIREFQPGDETAFRTLNEEWIVRYFEMEPKDQVSLADPRHYILDPGGQIFIAEENSGPVGCCALLARAPGEFEVAKMAVTESCQGKGIGRRLLVKCIDAARAMGANRLYIETNRKLTPAVRLYESLGFRHLPPERIVASPYARADVYLELNLGQTAGAVNDQ
jgi:putative acetyltransferase